ncbi:hypothetical protein V865_000704 [Kwoniella europaea PYCC6329]|uniref:Xylanolytic transcriptional activator regulatory domain-containing protein n=1 Tax=Kwoniella europaea PYCC6329 TaxID=1423913 RepID=A0AAX4K8Y7_9TREE
MSGELPSATSSGWSRIATGPSNTVQLGGDQSSSLDQDDQVANRAITQTHALVANMSTNVISQMNLVSSHFLDRCLSAYFNRFLAALPITHRATFNIRTTNAPLLLSMIAVGSLCLQSDDARRLGDSIWRLANTAVSSSWQELIKIKGDFDSCQGLALVTTVLLVQIYATASTDPELKNSAVVAQPLGFRCARLAGMFDTQTLTQAETVSSEFKALEGQALTDRWYKWSARETQQRTLLGLYLMDAQVCSLFDAAPSVRHTLSQLSPVCTDAAFYAPTAEAWQKVMVDEDGLYGSPYRGPLSTLYSCNPSSGPLRRSITSGFTVAALLDGIYCLVVEQRDLPLSLRNEEMSSLIDRLDRFRNDFLLSDKPEIDIPALAMKWHTTSISLLELWLPTGIALKENAESINKWFSTPQGRRAVLHANAIRQVVDTMPFSAISTPRIQTPVCTYHAGYIMMLWLKSHMCAKGAGNWDLDHEVDWQRLGSIGQVISQRDLVTAVEGGGPETFVTEGGTTTLRGRKFDATGISALISALTTFGGTWPAARTMTNQLIAMSYA